MFDSIIIAMALSFLIIVFLVIVIAKIPSGSSPAHRSYGVQSFTQNGEIVKSLAEKTLADYFKSINVRYCYEQSGDRRIRNPDFYLPDYDVYVEYWGLLNADDLWTRQNYEHNMRRKMAIYHRCNKRLVSIYPDNLSNLDWIFRAKFRNVTGFEIPN
jgi:hypothetical protein